MNHNMHQGRDEKGRMLTATHCWRGHELDSKNLYLNKRKDGRIARYCRTCRALSDKTASAVRRKENRQKYYSVLKTSACVDCGENRPATLHFDHIDPSQKSFTISDYLGKKIKWDVIYAEIGKCEVRCANCHAVRTAEQFGWYKDLQ